MDKKTAIFHIRLRPDQRTRLDAIHERHLTTDSAIGSALIDAFCDYVTKADKVSLPIQIVPQTTKSPIAKTA